MGSKKETWAEWVKKVGWAGKTTEERIKIRDGLKPAWWKRGLRLMREEWEPRRQKELVPNLKGLSSEEAKEQAQKFIERLAREGIYPVVIELPSDRDQRILYGKAPGDPAPAFNCPKGMGFLSSLGEQGAQLDKELRSIQADYDALSSKLDLDPFLSRNDLERFRRAPPGSDKRRLAELLKAQEKANRRYLKLWDKAKNVGVDHPSRMHHRFVQALKNAPRISIPMEEYSGPGYVHRMTPEDNVRIAEIEAQQVVDYEEAEKREEQRKRDEHRQDGGDGGDKKAENAKRKKAAEKTAEAERNRPRMDALTRYRNGHPDCTLPEAAKALFDAKTAPTVKAGEKWLRSLVSVLPPFKPGERGRPQKRGRPRKI
jgi:hypothetical protein